MTNIHLTCAIKKMQCYTNKNFENMCSYLKSCNYDCIKLYYNDIIKFNIKNIKTTTAKLNIKLIISINLLANIKHIEKHADYIEIYSLHYNNLNSHKIILNTPCTLR
eukprot:TRINITY_DN28011_c0_g1_i1.p1 TRINITY_DN28011_c0_g1~~TRINITY_DN28011_c0_g1_i1.p1  ORF type:complete len:107 (+),score=3.90 TRINITY_DN28011_c0_g1_i1:188-508(+)